MKKRHGSAAPLFLRAAQPPAKNGRERGAKPPLQQAVDDGIENALQEIDPLRADRHRTGRRERATGREFQHSHERVRCVAAEEGGDDDEDFARRLRLAQPPDLLSHDLEFHDAESSKSEDGWCYLTLRMSSGHLEYLVVSGEHYY